MPDSISIDSGVMLAPPLGESLGELVRSSILTRTGGRRIYCSGSALAELFYILCRRRGAEFARVTVSTLQKTRYITVLSSRELDAEAGRYKCERNLSLADCYVLALAKLLRATAVFARRESELAKELRTKPLGVDVLFLEDLAG